MWMKAFYLLTRREARHPLPADWESEGSSVRGRFPGDAGLVVDEAVEFLTGLHVFEERLDGALRFELCKGAGDGSHRDAQERDGEDDAVVAHLLEVAEGNDGGLAELGHVGEEEYVARGGGRAAEFGCEIGELLLGGEAFGKDHVGTGLDVGGGTLDGGVKALDASGVGTGADDEAGLCLLRGLRGPLDFFDHVVGGDEFFAVEVATALGELLVFEVETRGTGLGVFEDGSADHLGLAKAGVGVGDDGEARRVVGLFDGAGEVVEGEEADVGDACGDAGGGAGDIAGVEAGLLYGAGAEGVERAGHRDAGG